MATEESAPQSFMVEREGEPFTNRMFREVALQLRALGCVAPDAELLGMFTRLYAAGLLAGAQEPAE